MDVADEFGRVKQIVKGIYIPIFLMTTMEYTGIGIKFGKGMRKVF